MKHKPVTIAQVRAKIEEMTKELLSPCHLRVSRTWGAYHYELVFTELKPRSVLRFGLIQDVWDWLIDFENRNRSK